MTLVLNLYGGPGTGKSTIAAGVFSALKVDGRNVEYVHEFAKDLTWEQRHKTLKFQPYVIGKQMFKVWRLLGQVDVVITDSPILLGWYYASDETPDGFYDMVLEYHRMWNTLDILLHRDLRHHPYVEAGRNQTGVEAQEIDTKIEHILDQTGTPFRRVRVNHTTIDAVKQLTYDKMNWEY